MEQMKKILYLAVATLTMSCTSIKPTTVTLTYDSANQRYQLNNGQWTKATKDSDFQFDYSIDDEFTITSKNQIQSIKPIEFGYEYYVEVQGKHKALFYSADLYPYLEKTQFVQFEIVLNEK